MKEKSFLHFGQKYPPFKVIFVLFGFFIFFFFFFLLLVLICLLLPPLFFWVHPFVMSLHSLCSPHRFVSSYFIIMFFGIIFFWVNKVLIHTQLYFFFNLIRA